jgi:hypothetical protein
MADEAGNPALAERGLDPTLWRVILLLGRSMRISGSCHCGNITFEAESEFDKAMECNCSFCRRKGVLLAFVPRDRMRLTTPGA